MLVTEFQPNPLLIAELSKPTRWGFRNTDFVGSEGSRAIMIFSFTSGGGTANQVFTVGGVEFRTTVDANFTADSFNYADPSAEVAAKNFAGMLRSNYRFADYVISVEETGSLWNVFARAENIGEETAERMEIDVSGVAPIINVGFDAGADRTVRPSWLWYQFYTESTAVGARMYAPFDADGRVVIDVAPLARRAVGQVDPYLLWVRPELDERASLSVYVRYGSYEIVDGERAFGRIYESADVTLINSSRRIRETRGMRPYSPEYTLPVKWLDTRDLERCTYRGAFEFSAIWIQETAVLDNPNYRVRYRYFNAAGDEIAESFRDFRETGFHHVPIGPANFCHDPSAIAAATSYSVVIEVDDQDNGWVPYSEEIVLTILDANCVAREVYYLGALGAWQTFYFDRFQSERVELSSIEFDTYEEVSIYGYSTNLIQLNHDGGLESKVTEAVPFLVYVTRPLTEENRREYLDMMTSERLFLRTDSETLSAATRRIVPERSVVGLYERDNTIRGVSTFRYNTNRLIRG